MKALSVISGVQVEASGPSYCVVRTQQALGELGVESEIASLDWVPGTAVSAGIRLFPVAQGPRSLGRSPEMWHWINNALQRGVFDVVHNHGLWMMPNVIAGRAAAAANRPMILSPHGSFAKWAMQRSSLRKWLFEILLQRQAIAGVSCFQATSEREYFDIRLRGYKQPIAIIPIGIDIPELHCATLRPRRTLLFLGRLHPVKGLDILLKAWQAVSSRFTDWELKIVGPGHLQYKQELLALADDLGAERVEFVGALYGNEKAACYSGADLFVLPTHTENFGIAVAESLAASVPAIVTKGAPWSELGERKAGWWIDIGVDSLVACLEDALSRSPIELRAMGSRGREWMQAEFTWAEVGSQTAKTYDWLLGRCVKPSWIRLD